LSTPFARSATGSAQRDTTFYLTLAAVVAAVALILAGAYVGVRKDSDGRNMMSLLCVAGGLLMIGYGFYLTAIEKPVREKVSAAVDKGNETMAAAAETAASAASTSQSSVTPGVNPAPQAAVLNSTSEYIKALAELAKNLSGLSKAIAAFVVATLLFFFAAGLQAVDTPSGSDTEIESPAVPE
jgi:hypothetical protein